MQWYWWVLIGVAVVVLAFLKVKVGGAWLKKQKEKKVEKERNLEKD